MKINASILLFSISNAIMVRWTGSRLVLLTEDFECRAIRFDTISFALMRIGMLPQNRTQNRKVLRQNKNMKLNWKHKKEITIIINGNMHAKTARKVKLRNSEIQLNECFCCRHHHIHHHQDCRLVLSRSLNCALLSFWILHQSIELIFFF